MNVPYLLAASIYSILFLLLVLVLVVVVYVSFAAA